MPSTPIPKPFSISLPSSKLDWIIERVNSAYIVPDVVHPAGEEWSHGAPTAEVTRIINHWRNVYDWCKVERRMNDTFRMFTVKLEEQGEHLEVHFVHHRSKRADAVPLLYVHGWPGSFLEVEGLISRLVDPDDPNAQAFHIIAPSLPGFAFSSSPSRAGFNISAIAHLFNTLMVSTLGYSNFMAQGGDWGAGVVRTLAANHPTSCIAAHINFPQAFGPPPPLQHPFVFLSVILGRFTADEKERMERMQAWFTNELGYALIQGTKPQTISYALLDSPIGMLAWIFDKLHALVAPGYVWDAETVITWTMMYLIAGNAGHARIYKENMNAGAMPGVIGKEVAFGVSAFKYDTVFIPKWWAEASVARNITLWREHHVGGHYPTLECPDIFVKDIQDFLQSVSGAQQAQLIEAGSYT